MNEMAADCKVSESGLRNRSDDERVAVVDPAAETDTEAKAIKSLMLVIIMIDGLGL